MKGSPLQIRPNLLAFSSVQCKKLIISLRWVIESFCYIEEDNKVVLNMFLDLGIFIQVEGSTHFRVWSPIWQIVLWIRNRWNPEVTVIIMFRFVINLFAQWYWSCMYAWIVLWRKVWRFWGIGQWEPYELKSWFDCKKTKNQINQW